MPASSRQQTARRRQEPVPVPISAPSPEPRNTRLLVLIPVLLTLIIFTRMTFQWATLSDFTAHYKDAFSMLNDHTVLTSYCLFHLIFLAFWFMLSPIILLFHPGMEFYSPEHLRLSIQPAGTLTILLFVLGQSAVLYYLIHPLLAKRLPALRAGIAAGLLASALMLMNPISYFPPVDSQHYFGFIYTTVFHNPTSIVLKPLALLLFIQVLAILDARDTLTWKQGVMAFSLAILSTLAKPSYAICMLPVLAVYCVPMLLRREWRKFMLLAIAVALPIVLCLGWQYLITYGGNAESHIVWWPFKVATLYSSWLPLKITLSILFPLVVLLAFFRTVRQDSTVKLSWWIFLVSAGYFYLLAESGKRLPDGNLGWGMMVTLFILYVSSLLFLLRHRDEIVNKPKLRLSYQICWIIFTLHIVNGIAYFFTQYQRVLPH